MSGPELGILFLSDLTLIVGDKSLPLRGSDKMEIECTPRNFRGNELAPIGAYLSDEDGLIALLEARATRC
jgi:hypothetical protein